MHFIYKDEREKNIAAIVIYNKDGKFFFDPDHKSEMTNLEVEALLLRGALVDRGGKYYRPSSFNENNVSFSDAVINPEDIEVDLTGYATKDELNAKADINDIPTKISELQNDSNFLSSIPSEYVTETELNQKGYLTEHQSLDNYATKSYVSSEIANAQLEGGEVDLTGYVTKDELKDAIDAIEINPTPDNTPTTKLESIDVTLESGKTFTVPTECESQTIELTWSKPTSSGDMIFKNGASGTMPYQMPTGATQIASVFGTEVSQTAFDNDGSGAQIFGYVDITVGEGDTLTARNDRIYNIDGSSRADSNIAESGIYLISYTVTSRDSLLNRCVITSTNGASVINNIVLQSAYWLRENANATIGSHTAFANAFPASKVAFLEPGEEFSNSDIAKAKFNGVEITDEVSEYNIVPDMTIQCVSGILSFTYELLVEISSSTNVSSWVNYKWACIGDSYTDPSINADYKYEHIIADVTGIQIQTLGVGGTGWWKGYDTQSSYRFRASMVDLDTDVVTLFGSINDWKYYQGDSPLTLGTVTDTLSNGDNTLSAYINDVFDALEERVPTAQIIVFGPMYYHGLGDRPVELHETLKACTENRGYEYVNMLNVGWRRIMDNAEYAKTYCTDYSATAVTFGHPNNLAHETFIAPKFYNKLKEYLPIQN